MRLSRLHLHQFRSHDDRVFEIAPQVTAIIGENGSGKTNILEAIYTLLMGKSFRDGDDELISYEQSWYKVEGEIDGVKRELRFQPENKGKQLLIDGVSKGRFTYRQQLPVVLFEPDDLLMIHASPSHRRDYLDVLLQKIDPSYRQQMNRYERVLTQRNNLLKQRQSLRDLKDNIFVWDLSLADLGAKIIDARQELVTHINGLASNIYSDIAGKKQSLDFSYIHPSTQQTQSQIVAALNHHLDDDLRRGFTTVGPHRHDMDVNLNGQSAKHTASRGEVRTIMLAMKQIELKLIEDVTQFRPILLLDDVFSELDAKRKNRISNMADVQIIMTTTEVAKTKDMKIISLE